LKINDFLNDCNQKNMMNNQRYSPSGFGFLPPVVKNLLIINGLFFLATIVLGNTMNIDLTDLLGLHYFEAEKFAPYQFITYMFMHGNFSHIFFNMFALSMFGSVLEQAWGTKKFLFYYIVTGIGAAGTPCCPPTSRPWPRPRKEVDRWRPVAALAKIPGS